MKKNKYIFFDRDGVIIEDSHLLVEKKNVIIYSETFLAFKLLLNTKFQSIVVSNQPVVARGLISEKGVSKINKYISEKIFKETKYTISDFYFCPHHPNADNEDFRVNCSCRKPKPGMLLEAAKKYNIDLTLSWMIGDRISDIIAGYNAGCRTIMLKTGRHNDKPIVSDAMISGIKPDFLCNNILEAVKIILDDC